MIYASSSNRVSKRNVVIAMKHMQGKQMMLNKIMRKAYAKFLPKALRYPNVHLGGEEVRTLKLPFCKNHVVIRKSRSDVARVCEYINEIYTSGGYLNNVLIESKPTKLVDIGANIGLSTLNLIQKFPSIKEVIAVEAEEKNFEILEKNFAIWRKSFPNISFNAINAIASNVSGECYSISSLTDDPTLTASGTFRFEKISGDQEHHILESINVGSCVIDTQGDANVIVKIDIEGGEEYLFHDNASWLEEVGFLTIELHDRYDVKLIETSKNVLKSLVDYDFAVHPANDVLHCYNRKLFKTTN